MKLTWDFSELNDFADNLNNFSKFDEAMKRATQRLAKELLKWMKGFTPVDEYTLINGWNGNNFAVTKVKDGFEVLIVNKTSYALDVNDGHRVRNRKDGEYYPVRRRIQVRSAHPWQDPVSEWYVFGHFFVERGILRLTETTEIERIIMKELQQWWEGCING